VSLIVIKIAKFIFFTSGISEHQLYADCGPQLLSHELTTLHPPEC